MIDEKPKNTMKKLKLNLTIIEFAEKKNYDLEYWINKVLMKEISQSEEYENLKSVDLEKKECEALEKAIDEYRKIDREIVNETYRQLRESGIIKDEKNVYQLTEWKKRIEDRLKAKVEEHVQKV